MPLEDIGPEISVQDKIKLREICLKYNISIIEELDGSSKIYLGDDVIASWFKPFIVLKRDISIKDRRKQLYVEIHCNWDSVFEKETNE